MTTVLVLPCAGKVETDSALCHFLCAADVTLLLQHVLSLTQAHHSHDEIIQYTQPLLDSFMTVIAFLPNFFLLKYVIVLHVRLTLNINYGHA